ncbi:MAG: pyrroline-5-carboxylate reductase [Proteobacteria bacterium]|nr:MAG: pyrroline-5-carboxylate reductase [Pseudomonadota bacterium]
MQNLNITFIGGGNMAEALISGLKQSGHSSQHICVSDINEDRLRDLHQRYDVKIDSDNISAIAHSDILLLAVKPQQMDAVLAGISEYLPSGLTIISIAAGIHMLRLKQFLNSEDAGVVRVMPNTPALVGAGMSVLFSDADEIHKKRAEYVLAASGETAWVDEEKHMHAVTAVSGSGPAYFFLLAEVMQAAGESLGLSKELAAKLAAQTALGSGKMLVESGRNASDLRTQVTSPGGTTQAALDEMYECGLPDAVRKGVAAASKRSRELAA